MRKAKSIFQGKNEPVWVRPTLESFPRNTQTILYPVFGFAGVSSNRHLFICHFRACVSARACTAFALRTSKLFFLLATPVSA